MLVVPTLRCEERSSDEGSFLTRDCPALRLLAMWTRHLVTEKQTNSIKTLPEKGRSTEY